MMSLQTLRANKKILRKAVNSTLKTLPESSIDEQSSAISARILSSAFFQRSNVVSCYLSMPTGEVDTSSVVSEVLRSGKTLFVPRIDQSADKHMDFLKIYGEDDLRTLPSGVWGIKEPSDEWQSQKRVSAVCEAAERLDLILLPGVAFDRSLSRLGHGKGYYDQFLSSYVASGRQKPLLVALALREQVLDGGQVPMGEYDWKVDMIVTPDEIIGVRL